MNDALLYGKSNFSRIVSINPYDDKAEIFTREENGNLKSHIIPNKYWILTNDVKSQWRPLKGNNHYKYGKMFETREEFQKTRQKLKRNNKDIYSIYDSTESLMVLKGLTYFRDLKPSDLAVLSFDLETTGLLLNSTSKILLISNIFRHKGIITKKLFAYDEFDSEADMLLAWTKFVREMDPDLIIAHNGLSFDFKYLNFLARRAEIKLNLGRDNSPLEISNYESKFRKDGSQDLPYNKCKIYGREIVDTMFLAYKYDFQRNYPSYGLKPIIAYEKLEKPGRTFYDASKIRKNYKIPSEWEKIKEYAKDDADDSLALFDLMAPAQFYLARSIPKSFQSITESATGSQLNSFLIRSYLQNGHSIPKTSQLDKVKGGISFGIPGIYSNVIKIDLKSAYPSQILRFKLFDPEKDPEGNFYKMVHHFTYERFDLKTQYKATGDKYFSDREQASKIVINSAYGLMNTPGLNFNNSSIANKITEETRQTIELALNWASGKGMDFYKQYMKEEENNELEN